LRSTRPYGDRPDPVGRGPPLDFCAPKPVGRDERAVASRPAVAQADLEDSETGVVWSRFDGLAARL
jgi:hypothetical protein